MFKLNCAITIKNKEELTKETYHNMVRQVREMIKHYDDMPNVDGTIITSGNYDHTIERVYLQVGPFKNGPNWRVWSYFTDLD